MCTLTVGFKLDPVVGAECNLLLAHKLAFDVVDCACLGIFKDSVRLLACGTGAIVANGGDERRRGIVGFVGAKFVGPPA